MKRLLLIALLALCIEVVVGSSFTDVNNATHIFTSPSYRVGKNRYNFNITGSLVLADPLDGCSPLKNKETVAGNIVLLQKTVSCYPLTRIKHVQDAEALAAVVVTVDLIAGSDSWSLYTGQSDKDIYVPSVTISVGDGTELLKLFNSGPIIATVYPDYE